jgi:3-hydroxyisobutyrate dehydrogenase-like beta-hydroxyacid dehydrogenase
MKNVQTVGLLGLGKMGNPMARYLQAGGFKVTGYDPAAAACAQARSVGARVVASPREVAQAAELVIVVVGFEAEVEEAIFGKDGLIHGARPGLVVAVASTVAPAYAKRLATRLAAAGLVPLDIPLARGEGAAAAGKLLIYGAGDEAAFAACRPAFATFASDIFHLGPAGAGQVGKMVNNLILWTCISVNDEGLRLAQALGVDPERLCEALRHGSGQNWAMDTRAERSNMPWAEKDMSIVLHEADHARLSLPLAGTVKEVIKGLKIRLGMGMPKGRDEG